MGNPSLIWRRYGGHHGAYANALFNASLPRQLPKALFREVCPDAGVIGIIPQGRQNARWQVEDLECSGDPGMVLPGGSGESPDAPAALLLHQPAITLGAFPGGRFGHPVLVDSPGAGLDGAVAGEPSGGFAADKGKPMPLVDEEEIFEKYDAMRSISDFVHFEIPVEGDLLEIESG
jgi:hypothetical protein